MRTVLFLAGVLAAAPAVAEVAVAGAARPMVLPAVAAVPGAARELGAARPGASPLLLTRTEAGSEPAVRAGEGADNTGRNRSHDQRIEAEDQSNREADVELVARIRRALTGDDQLSTNARNIKVIVSGRAVTLRGPVASDAERRRVETLVRQAASGLEVVNQLEVAPR